MNPALMAAGGLAAAAAGLGLMLLDASRARRTRLPTALSRRWTSIACLFVGAGLLAVTNAQRDAQTKARRAEEAAAMASQRAALERDLDQAQQRLDALRAEQARAQ